MAKQESHPNKNMFPIEAAENGIRGAINALCDLGALNEIQTELQGQCINCLLKFQGGPMLELRKAVE